MNSDKLAHARAESGTKCIDFLLRVGGTEADAQRAIRLLCPKAEG